MHPYATTVDLQWKTLQYIPMILLESPSPRQRLESASDMDLQLYLLQLVQVKHGDGDKIIFPSHKLMAANGITSIYGWFSQL